MFKVSSVKALPGYRLRVTYANGVEGTVDLSDLVGQGVFELWNDPRTFAQVIVGDVGEIRWSDDVELCPDAVYLQITGQSPEEVFPNLKAVVNA
jgi:hypothetical protein